MRSLVALTLLALTPAALAQQKPVIDGTELVRAWKDRDEAGVKRALGRLRARILDPQRRVGIASHPSVSIDYMAKAAVRLAPGVEAGVGVGGQDGQASLAFRQVKWTGSTNPHDRSITSTIEHAVLPLGNGIVVKSGYSSSLSYKTNLQYLNAMGRESVLPNSSTVLRLMDRVLAPHRTDAAPPTSPSTGSAVLGALKDAVIPRMFTAATEYDEVTIGEILVFGDATGSFSFTHAEWERLARGQRQGEGVTFTEDSISSEIGAAFGKRGKAGIQLTLTVTTDPEAKPDPDKARILDLMRTGRWQELARLGAAKLAPVLEGERMAKALAMLERYGRQAVEGAGRILATADVEVGGVRLSFDPALLESAVPPEEAARVLDRFLAQREQGRENFLVTSASGELLLHAVSLRDLLARDARTLGSLTRVRGFVLAPDGDFVLLGEVTTGMPRIDLDNLSVALRTIWKEGSFPSISLEPDVDDYSRPLTVKIGGLPEDLENTELVRILVEADYAMKLITFGEDRLDVPGFLCWHDLLQIRPAGEPEEVASRDWLVPMPSRTADVWVHESERGTAVLFDSRVQVLTENEWRVQGFRISTGKTDPISAEAVDRFTRCFDEIARRREIFHDLSAVFDLAKLSAIARHRGIRHPLLERAANRVVRVVEVKRVRAGIGPKKVEGTKIEISGGATTRVPLSRRVYKDTRQLSPLLEARGKGPVAVSFPTSVALSASEVLDASSDVALLRGGAALLEKNYAECERLMTEALERDDRLTEARAFRGLSRFLRGRPEQALGDIDRAAVEIPHLRALAGLLRILGGDRDGALADAAAAARARPDHPAVLTCNAMTWIYGFDLSRAEAATRRLLDEFPTDPAGGNRWMLLDLLYKLGPERARARVELMRRVPLPILDAYTEGVIAVQNLDLILGARRLKDCIRRIDASPPHPAVSALHLRERAQMLRIYALTFNRRIVENLDFERATEVMGGAEEDLADLAARHPDWPSTHLLRILVGADDAGSPLEHFESALAQRGVADPLMEDLSVLLGTDRALAWFGLTLVSQALLEKKHRGEIGGLLERTVEVMGDGPDADLVERFLELETLPPGVVRPRLREALARFPDKLPPDPVTVLAVSLVSLSCIGLEGMHGNLDDLKAMVGRYLEITDVDELPHACWTMVSLFRFACESALVRRYEEELNDDDRWHDLRTEIANGRAEVGQIREALEAAKEEVRSEFLEGCTPLMRFWSRATFERPAVERQLHDLARKALPSVTDPDRRARMEKELDAWNRKLNPERSGEPRFDRFERALDELSRASTRPAEVHGLSLFARIFSLGGQVAIADHPKAAMVMARIAHAFQRRIRGLTSKRRGHDWASWLARRPPDRAPEPEAPPPTRDWTGLLVAAGLGILLLGALVRRAIRRRAA